MLVSGLEFNKSPLMTPETDVAAPHIHCPILIVEDDEDLREMMAQLLALEGFKAETAANGREALAYLALGDRPDVILLDLMMPVMDGWEFRRQQVTDPALAAVPVVVLSAVEPARAEALGGPAAGEGVAGPTRNAPTQGDTPLDFQHLAAVYDQADPPAKRKTE